MSDWRVTDGTASPVGAAATPPCSQDNLRHTRVIRQWQRVRTLVKSKKKRIGAQTSSPLLLNQRDALTPTVSPFAQQPARQLLASEKKPPHRKLSTITTERETYLAKFRRAARLLQILLRVSNSIIRFSCDNPRRELKSLREFHNDLEGAGALRNSGLVFDPAYFKVKKEVQLSKDVKRILTKYPSERSADEVHLVMFALKHAVRAFGDFPIKMQESLATVGWYERFEAQRVIIRQGHKAESFYLILSGTSTVTISSPDPVTSEPNIRVVAFLNRGNSFGELALIHHSTRQATVCCRGPVELLSIGREDFTDIFMHRNEGMEPEFIRYLRSLDVLNGWPVQRLPYDNPDVCLFTYFRRGVVICKDSNKSEWIYFVKMGTCRVLKKLKAPRRLFRARSDLMNLFEPGREETKRPATTRASAYRDHRQRHVTSPDKSTSSRRNLSRSSSSCTRLPSVIQQRSSTSPAVFSIPTTYTNQVQAHMNLIQEKLQLIQLEPQDSASQCGDKEIFIQINKLNHGDTFGLIPLVFGETEGAPSVTLVSEGAECVLVSKRFFLNHFSEEHKKSLRKRLRPYPSEARLQEKLQEQTDWDEFKFHTMQKAINEHGHKTASQPTEFSL